MLDNNSVFIGVDPDGAHTAFAAVSSRGIHAVIGGGSRQAGRALCTHAGALALLEGWPGARAAVERQTPGPWSRSCEALAIVHGIWVGACDVARVPYTGVLPRVWQSRWAQLAPLTGALRGARKPYHQAAIQHCPRIANEDQAASLGIAVWLAHLHDVTVPLVRVDAET